MNVSRTISRILAAAGGRANIDSLRMCGHGGLVSRYDVNGLASAAIGGAAMMLARWIDPDRDVPVAVDQGLASRWFGYTLEPSGWSIPPVRSAITGDYRTNDGWIRIHANARDHRLRALSAMGLALTASRADVAACAANWTAVALEDAIVEAGGCAAALRAPERWRRHPQGMAIASEPLIDGHVGHGRASPPGNETVDRHRPLQGIRVLDLTRVLAGPVATRFLAAYGARVLRLDPDDWEEPGMVPEVTVGKRCARLDLHDRAGSRLFESLLSRADVLAHGYRPGVLERLGFGAGVRRALRPGLIDVTLDAWGWTGPWKRRRGFDSLVQMSTGIAFPAAAGSAPDPLPVQALDQATGYLMAVSVLRGLIVRRECGRGSHWRVSLARTAELLLRDREGRVEATCPAPSESDADPLPVPESRATLVERTAWGPAWRPPAPCKVGDADWYWDRGACALRGDPPSWW